MSVTSKDIRLLKDKLCCIIDNTSNLAQVVALLQADQDYEAKLVVDGNGDTYLEVRIWNPDTQTWETPLYYAPGSNSGVASGSLTPPINYINPNSYLSLISGSLTAASRTHNYVNTSTTGSVASGSIRGSVMNVGASAGTWNGSSLPAGASVPWGEVGMRDTYGAISYDATGTTFIIEYTT